MTKSIAIMTAAWPDKPRGGRLFSARTESAFQPAVRKIFGRRRAAFSPPQARFMAVSKRMRRLLLRLVKRVFAKLLDGRASSPHHCRPCQFLLWKMGFSAAKSRLVPSHTPLDLFENSRGFDPFELSAVFLRARSRGRLFSARTESAFQPAVRKILDGDAQLFRRRRLDLWP